MVLRNCVSVAALAAGIFAAGLAHANQEYIVFAGVGPQLSRDVAPSRAHLGHPAVNAAPVARQPTPQAQQYATANSGGYGGGFIELLVTGRDPTPRAAVTNTPPADSSYQRFRGNYGAPAPAVEYAPRAAPARQAAIAPTAAMPSRRVNPRFERQEVDYAGRHAAGSIIVDTPSRYLYLVLGNGRAMRYGIGVGRPGFEWAGVKAVTRKAEWPDWRPPAEMLKRRPDLPTFMKGGPANPLGARALYLGSSLYRIHGTNEPWTIGQNVSSGCIRMMNDDVVDLYKRVNVGTRVVVI
ncbi:MAG: L,D-transpeptidase [Beijerinckiaceae bacterium]|nr:L,D-transpeptidase [Beijerinckiaceae bacterium]